MAALPCWHLLVSSSGSLLNMKSFNCLNCVLLSLQLWLLS